MKAIQQIIRHFRARGVLSARQCADLRDRGFLPQDDSYELLAEESVSRESDLGTLAEGRHQALIEAAEAEHGRSFGKDKGRSGKRGGRKSASVRRARVLDSTGLVRRLRKEFEGWPERLAGLVSLGRILGVRGDWKSAALTVRSANERDLADAVAAGLNARNPALDELFEALAMEDYCAVAENARGPAVTAYKALLGSAGELPEGRYRWVLTHDEVAAVWNLRSAQRRVLRATGTVLTERPELIARGMLRDRHILSYWALALVYSARRGRPFKRPPPASDEHLPKLPIPDGDAWTRAWTLAMLIDPLPVASFLGEYHAVEDATIDMAHQYEPHVTPEAARELAMKAAACELTGRPELADVEARVEGFNWLCNWWHNVLEVRIVHYRRESKNMAEFERRIRALIKEISILFCPRNWDWKTGESRMLSELDV